jgi:hypothetical protein
MTYYVYIQHATACVYKALAQDVAQDENSGISEHKHQTYTASVHIVCSLTVAITQWCVYDLNGPLNASLQ